MANFEIQTKWFAESAPVNANEASINIGSGADGIVTIEADAVGTEGNNYTIQVVVGSGNNVAMSAVLTGSDILVTLGTDGVGALAPAKNTALLIAGAINALPEVNAVASGTGATSISGAITKTNFTGGTYGTEVIVPYTMLQDENYYYVNIAPNDSKGKSWRRFTLATY